MLLSLARALFSLFLKNEENQMKQGMKKQLVWSATVSGIFLFSPVVLAAEEQNAPTIEEVTGGDQVSSENSSGDTNCYSPNIRRYSDWSN